MHKIFRLTHGSSGSSLAMGLALAIGTLAPAVRAANAPAPSAQSQSAALGAVVVTGTHVPGRTVASSLSPIDILTEQELIRTGAPDLNTALRVLLPSFNFPTPSLTDATDASAPAQLRGLSPDETLVLINGKRQHTTSIVNVSGWYVGRGSSPVDLAAIPINSIARIEVLRDGAAAQYGSDAIAGVINIILKTGTDHGSASVTYGQYDKGQGATRQAGADGGIARGARGWVHASADYLDQDSTNQARPDYRFPGDPRYGTVTFHYGLPAEIQKQVALNAQYQLGDHATLYGFGLYNHREVDSSAFFRAFTQYGALAPAAAQVYPAGFLPLEHDGLRDDTEVVGLRGDLAGWDYDLSSDSGGNHWQLNTTNTFNFSLGSASPTAFYIGALAIRMNEWNADFRRAFDMPWYGPLTVAWGLAYRHQRFSIGQGDGASYAGTGSQGFAGFQPIDAGSHARSNAAEYVDFETNLTRELSAGLAARHEHYSDFGDANVWKLSGRYAFTPVVAARGTVSTGFRAPSLQQEFYSSTTTNSVANPNTGQLQLYDIRTLPVSDPAAIALGAQPLGPEKSRNLSLGLVVTPAEGPQATLDFYRIDITNRIVLSGSLVGSEVQSYLASVGIPQVEGGNFFTNGVSTRTRGADLVLTWPIALQSSSVKFTGGFNYNKTTILSIAPNPPQLALAGLVLPVVNRQEQGLLTVDTPLTKGFVAADWSFGNWGLHGQLNRYGGFTALSSAPIGDQTFPSRMLADLSASYAVNDWTFTLGSNNAFNVYPAETDAANNFDGMLPYHFLSPFGFNGRYVYGTVGYRW